MRARLLAATLGVAVAGLTTADAAVAQGIDYGSETSIPTPAERSGWTVGLGAGAVPDYEGSDDYEAVPIPYLHWQGGNRYFDLTGLTASANLLDDDLIEVGPRLRIRRKRDDVHNDRVDRLQSTDTAVEVGGFVALNYERWRAEAWFSQDVADAHSGQLAGLKGDYTWPINPSWVLKSSLTTTYASGKFMETYFGVDSRNAQRSGLRQFDADAGFKDVGGDLALTYRGWGNWGVTGFVAYDRLLNDAEDSPVTKVGSPNQFFFGTLVTYRFDTSS
jgi:outer membrane protein